MTWLALLLALFLEQMSFPALRGRIQAWTQLWPRWVMNSAAPVAPGSASVWAWSLLAVLGPALAAHGVQMLLGGFFGWFWVLFVFYACVGFSVFIRQAAALREAVEWHDQNALTDMISAHAPEAMRLKASANAQALAAVVMLAQRHILAVLAAGVLGWLLGAPLFFVVLLWAAQAWRQALAQVGADEAWACGSVWLERLDTAAAWATAVSLAVGGQFDAVIRALRRRAPAHPRKAMELLGDASGAALGLPEDWMDKARAEGDADAIEIGHFLRWDGLVWRSLGVWLLVFAALSILAW